MRCNGSKNDAPQLHTLAYIWSSCVKVLPVQMIFLGTAADLGNIIYAGDATDQCIYVHTPATNDTYPMVDNVYMDWFEIKFPARLISRKYTVCLSCITRPSRKW